MNFFVGGRGANADPISVPPLSRLSYNGRAAGMHRKYMQLYRAEAFCKAFSSLSLLLSFNALALPLLIMEIGDIFRMFHLHLKWLILNFQQKQDPESSLPPFSYKMIQIARKIAPEACQPV